MPPSIFQLYTNILIPASNAFRDISLEGVYVDQSHLSNLIESWVPKALSMEAQLQEIAFEAGWPDRTLNIGSAPQRARLVYDVLDAPLNPRLGRTTNKKVMTDFAELDIHPFFDSWLNGMHMDHLLRTYIKPMPYFIRRTGCIHPEVRLHNTTTGRLAYAKPPLQQTPKYVELSFDAESGLEGFGNEATELRKLFAVRDPQTYVIVEFDYARIELYTGAHVSGDEVLLAALLDGDFHGKTAERIFKIDLKEVLQKQGSTKVDEYRRNSKYVTFGILNNRGAAALARGELREFTGGGPNRPGSTKLCQDFIDDWHRTYKKYALYKEQVQLEAMREGELVSDTGRIRRFKLIQESDHHSRNQAINFRVQGLASDVCLSALIELHQGFKKRAYGERVLLTVHDCIVFELPIARLDDSLCYIEAVMTAPRFPGLPSIPIEGKAGPSWGDTKKLTRIGSHWSTEKEKEKAA